MPRRKTTGKRKAISRNRHHHQPNLQVRWQNFRAFRDTDWLTFRPLTIVIGPNNSGKTSLLAPLLLLNQTMLSRDSRNPLVSRGPLFDSPTFDGLLSRQNRALEMVLGLRFHTHVPSRRLLAQAVGSAPPGALEIKLQATDDPAQPLLTSYAVDDIFLRQMLRRDAVESGKYNTRGIVSQRRLTSTERAILTRSKPNHFLFAPAQDLARFVTEEKSGPKTRKSGPKTRKSGPNTLNFSRSFSLYLAITGYVFTQVRALLDSLSYIGPIRERLKHHYPVASEEARSVGPTGDRTANLLRQRFKELQPKLDGWIRKFEFGEGIKYRDLDESKQVFSLELVSGKRRTNIADAGFGASQVLPLIVQALAGAPGSLTIAEQPEIHLNPKLQAVLADLFVEMALAKRPVVVETHSEHLLLRIRRLIAEGVIDPSRVAVYFVEQKEGVSDVRRIEIQDDGHINAQEWPEGFFAESLRESLALATAQVKVKKAPAKSAN